MTKQVAIQKAYKEAYITNSHLIDKDGWHFSAEWFRIDDENLPYEILNYKTKYALYNLDLEEEFLHPNEESSTIRFRPKSLSGIEHNNGWTKIESESDLPKKEDTRLFNVWMLETNSESPSKNQSWDVRSAYVQGWISHFRPVVENLKPIY